MYLEPMYKIFVHFLINGDFKLLDYIDLLINLLIETDILVKAWEYFITNSF